MKKNWEVKKLGEVCLIKPPKSEARKQLGGSDLVSFVPMENMGIGSKYLVASQVRSLEDVAGSYTYFAEEDVLLAKITPCFENGKLGIARNLSNGVGFGSSEYIVFRTNESLHNEFLYYFLSREQFREEGAQRMSGAVGHKRVAKDFIENYPIPVPPLPEQQRIVAILDEAFAVITTAKENAEKNLQNARELFESYLQNVFSNPGDGWEEKKLKEVGITQTGTTPKTSNMGNYGDYIPFIKPADIDIFGNGELRYDNEGLSQEGLKNGRTMPEGSVLMVCIGASIGKVGFAERDVSCNQQINALTVSPSCYPKFFYYALRTQEFIKKVILNSAQATLPIINKSKWENLSVHFPKSLPEQRTIVAKLDTLSAETNKLEAIYRQKLADLDELKKSVLKKAFDGEL